MAQTETVRTRRTPQSIAAGIWLWSRHFGDGETFFNSYLIQTDADEAVVIDPVRHTGDDKPMDWQVFDDLPTPRAIWLTSSDHERDSRAFREHFDVPLCAAEAESGLMSKKPDKALSDGETLQGGWRVIQLDDQKTPAECAFYQPDRRLLIVGDALLSNVGGVLRRPYDEPSAYPDEEKSRQGLDVLKAVDVTGILVGHGDPVLQGAQQQLEDALSVDPRKLA